MNWKDFLENCNLEYSNGLIHTVTFDDMECIKKETGIVLEVLAPVTDKVYDQVYYKCKELFPNDPFFNKLASVNTGYGVDIDLPTPAGSLDECKLTELEKWINPNQDYVISEKLDGCSIILFYESGMFKQAVTRGDGYKGKDVTRHIRGLVPSIIENNFTGMVRGEIICPKKDIQSMINELKEETGKEYKNGRNTIAGFLNSKETLKSVKKYAKVVVYSIMDSNKPQSEQFKWLDLYFNTVASHQIYHGNQITEPDMIKRVNWYHEYGTYETDGIVVTLDQFGKVMYETNSINPTNARKFKVISSNGETEQRVRTNITDITWQVSKDGKLKPVLQVMPIDINGVTVSNVTGNNYQWISDRKCGIGSEVELVRSNSVIPKIVEVRTNSTNFNLPTGTHQEGVDLVLDNKDTTEVTVQRLVHFAEALELEQAGQASMEKLLDAYPEIKNPVEMFGLTLGAFRLVLGVNGVKLFESLKKACDNMTESKLADACGCFGAGLGENLLLQIEQKYGDLVLLTEGIENFGSSRLKQYQENYSTWLDTKTIYLNKHGGKFNIQQNNTNLPLKEYIICFTGIRDKEFAKYLKNNGATIVESFNKKVNTLIVKDINMTSTKIERAKEQGCQILSITQAKIQFGQKMI